VRRWTLNSYYKLPDGVVYHGDALEILPTLADNSVDLILTDPPYMISREMSISRKPNYKFKGPDINFDYGEWDKIWDNEDEYYEWNFSWLKEAV